MCRIVLTISIRYIIQVKIILRDTYKCMITSGIMFISTVRDRKSVRYYGK